MKTWKKYSQYLLSGEWHIHTSYTDGDNTISDYCQRATERGIPLVAFTEHVRLDLSYDFNAFLEDIDNARMQYDLIILSGCEAKVLPHGILDVDDNTLKQVDYPIFAFHSFPSSAGTEGSIEALYTVLKNPHVNTWAHPGSFFNRSGMHIPEEELFRIFRTLKNNEILVELNKKYHYQSDDWLSFAKRTQVNFVRGSDCHKIAEME